MPNEFKIEVPIQFKGEGEGKKIGKSIAEQMKKEMGAVGIGKGGKTATGTFGEAMGLKSLGKMTGILGLILIAVDSLKFIIKPLVEMFKYLFMILFLPLIPILIPVLQALGEIIKEIAPYMKKLMSAGMKGAEFAPQFKEAENGLINAMISIANAALKVGGSIGQIIFEIGKGAFDLGAKIGQWIFDKVMVPVSDFLTKLILNSAKGISNAVQSGLNSLKNLGVKIWEWFKSLFTGSISVVTQVWDFIKGLFRGTINVASTVWNWFKGLFGGSSKTKSVGDAIITPGGIVKTDPSDYIIATKNPQNLGGGSITNNITINNPTISQRSDINDLVNQIEDKLKLGMRRRISYGPRNF